MNLKVWIKNEFWVLNYMIPLTSKYLPQGSYFYLRKAFKVFFNTKVIHIKKNDITDIDNLKRLMEKIEVKYSEGKYFFYDIDESWTVAVTGNVLSNFTLDYKRVIDRSFKEIVEEAIGIGGKYGENAKLTLEAIELLYEKCFAVIKNTKNNGLISNFQFLLEKKAEHFSEGLQRILFFNQYLWQTRHRLNGLGRLDKILGSLFEQDLKSGVINEENAKEILKDFLRCLHKHYEFKSAALLGDIGQIIVLGGVEKNGKYFCNKLTYFFLEVQAELGFPDPKIILRVADKMPDDLFELSVKCLLCRTGSPLLSNDDVIIPALIQYGYDEDDAYDYCVSACWEPFIVGKSLDSNNIKVFDFFETFHRYMETEDLSKIGDFGDLIEHFEAFLMKDINSFAIQLNEYKWAADPFVSMLTDDCNTRGIDISLGGAKYNNYGVTTVGMPNLIDSLFHIKKMVFEEKKYSLNELERYRRNNYKNHEKVFCQLKNSPSYFAHDEKEVVELVNRLIKACDEVLKTFRNPLGGRIKIGLSSPNYVISGKRTSADFAGRKKGMPYSTHISGKDSTYTELVNFAGNIDYAKSCVNGNVVDYFITPQLIENNMDKFILFLKSSIKVGFYQMQMNVMDSKTLIDAKAHPEKYPGLIVRVWGFSAYFNDLPVEYKDNLIKRAMEHEKCFSH